MNAKTPRRQGIRGEDHLCGFLGVLASWRGGSPTWRSILLVSGCALIGSQSLRGEEPTTAPSDSQISALVDQLGNDDPIVRKSASEKLLQAGDAAKTALQQAGQGDDPQIRSQAQELLQELEVPTLPDTAPSGTVVGNMPTFSYSSNLQGDVRRTTVTIGGRTTVIQDGPDGIEMTVAGWVNGQRMSKSFKAKDAEQLKKIAPQWYNLWSTTGAGTGQMTLRTNGGQITLRGGALVINRGIPGGGFIMQPPGVVQLPGGVMQLPGGVVQLQVGGGAMPSDDLVQLRQNINDEIARSKLTADQSKAVLDQLARVQTAHDDVGAGGDPAKENEQYLNNCDALRKQLANAGLSDPGTLLPPPANSRLGVTVSNASDLPGAGVAVGSVIDGSRAQKIGLIANDIIKTMNDQPINDITDLRKIVMASKQLSLIVIRNGQEVTLREAAAAATQPAK